jgi:hypothetical protein
MERLDYSKYPANVMKIQFGVFCIPGELRSEKSGIEKQNW